MKTQTRLIIACAILILALNLAAQEEINWRHWSSGTAYVLPKHRMEVGLFQPLRYGYTENLECTVHPLAFFLMPNIDVKWAFFQTEKMALASRHGFTFPAPLLRTIAKSGTGGIISPEFNIPNIYSLQNELLVSIPIGDNHLFTGKAAINLAFNSHRLDERTTIDLPIVYSRTGVFYHNYGLKLGGDLQGKVFGRWNFLADADLFYYPTAAADINFAFEHKGLLSWNKSRSFQLCLGYMLVYGEYPFGTQWHLLPLADLQWAWPRR